ncbi:MAG TPA: amidohydrolase [Xanthomonadales bacterium]|nr:amidohydrolase [Xanthomonadales bacterium]
MKPLRISLIQGDTRWHDPAGNRDQYGRRLRDLAGATDLVVLPETFTSGFSNDALERAEGMAGPTVVWLRESAAEIGAVIAGSVQIRTEQGVYNRLLWARPDGSIGQYDKRHLFRMAGEHERYAAGSERMVFELAGWRICPLVCYDLRFPVFSRNRFDPQHQRFDYDLLLFVANWPAARREHWRTLLRARAIENLAWVAAVNRVGRDGNDIDYAGDSAVIDPLGRTLAELAFEPATVTLTLSGELLQEHRRRFPAQLDADRFELI